MVQEVARRVNKRRGVKPERNSEVIPAGRKLGAKIEKVIQAFETPEQRHHAVDRVMTFNQHRVGRIERPPEGDHTPHLHREFDHYYETTDINSSGDRFGIFISGDQVEYYEILATEMGEQIKCSPGDNQLEIINLVSSFQRMPHFPGDLKIN